MIEIEEKIMSKNHKNEERWLENYELAKIYYECYGDLLIHQDFRTSDGYTYDEAGVRLGIWITTQKQNYEMLSEERKQKLGEIGFVLNYNAEKWIKNYELARKYYEHHGDLLIPSKFKTSDGYTYDEQGVKLGSWLESQKKHYEKLSEERKQKLGEIGFVLSPNGERWLKNYELARKYYEHHGDLLISVKFKTNDGYTYDEQGIKLGSWLVSQKTYYEKLSEERKQKLNEIGFVLNAFDESWLKNYGLAKKYYEHHCDLLIPVKFKTNDGCTYDESGVKLGNWIMNQRHGHKKLSEERKTLLSSIGMIWNIKKNKEKINDICLQNDIDEPKNKSILKHISFQELSSKIEFVKSYNILPVDKNGLLIDIFSMNNIDMQEKYGISLEDLISEYYVSKDKIKKL